MSFLVCFDTVFFIPFFVVFRGREKCVWWVVHALLLGCKCLKQEENGGKGMPW